MTFRLGHISDLHLLVLGGVPVRAFFNKRLTGGANLLLRRARQHRAEVAEQGFRALATAGVDHVMVTGDLSNLALEPEFLRARDMLASFGDGHRLSVIPGNHDRYTRRAAREGRFERLFGEWMQTDLPELALDGPYPFVKLLGRTESEQVALIGLSSAVPTPPMFATGTVSRSQLDGLRRALRHEAVRVRFKVVAVHHHLVPPPYRRFDRLRRLTNAPALLEVLLQGGVDLVLHGHNHRPGLTEHARPDDGGVLRIVEAGSGSTVHRQPEEFAAKVNIYDIADGRLARIERYSYGSDGAAGGFAFRPWQTVTP